MPSEETSDVEIDSFLLAQVKAHLLIDILPGMLGLPVAKQSQKFRERVLKEWISTAIEEKLKKEEFWPVRNG